MRRRALLGAALLPAPALRALAPLRAAGAAPLTLLVLHLVLSALLGIAVMTAWFLASERKLILEERQTGVRQVVEAAHGIATPLGCGRSARRWAAVRGMGTCRCRNAPQRSDGDPSCGRSSNASAATSALSTSAVPRRCPATFSTSSTRPVIQ